MHKYQVEDWLGGLIIDRRIFLPQEQLRKTPEELQQKFYTSWKDQLVAAFPVLKEGETQQQLLEQGDFYKRPHVEIYSLHIKAGRTFDTTHMKFMSEAKLAGLHIESAVALDTSRPWYRRVLRREPRITTVAFVLIVPPRSTP